MAHIGAQSSKPQSAPGVNRDDGPFGRPLPCCAGIASVWYEGNPCNMNLLDLSVDVKSSVQAAGLVGLRFNTIGVSDGISMGTRGMSYSLPSREIIADSVETVMRAQWYDGCVAIAGCDKNVRREDITYFLLWWSSLRLNRVHSSCRTQCFSPDLILMLKMSVLVLF